MVVLYPPPKPPSTPPRVAVTGVGIVTALGLGWQANAEGFRTGRTAFRPITLFDVSRQRVKVAAEVDLPERLPDSHLSSRRQARQDRAGRLLLLAALEAWDQAKIERARDVPMVLGTTSGGMGMGEAYYRQATREATRHRRQATRVVEYQAQRQGVEVAEALDISGSITIIANACASGANAVGHAWHWLRFGRATRILCGGYDALSQLVFAGFDSLQALSPTCCRPFDARRDGLALGEGAAVFVLETWEEATRRGATVLGEICGYGATNDAHHLTQPHPQGDAALASMTAACREAGIEPEQVGYVNAHGTGTPLNDSAEAAAISRWARERASTLPVSSTKASIGHLLGGAGAVETAICLMALRGQWFPPTCTHEKPDPACSFPVVTRPQAGPIEYVLSNSFGFGGANASLVLRKSA
jgi:3-oxoacyl-[acyl-carrier-protein] synthase II